MDLKYLFIAAFKDGSIYQQNREDKPVLHPREDGSGSSFTDVAARIDEVDHFILVHSDPDKTESYKVNLSDGSFEVNGLKFFVEGDKPLPPMGNRTLIFYRQHQHDFRGGVEADHRVTYCIGWQATIKGKNYQQVIKIA